jgi:ABC-2 type transport system permease protein
MRQPARIAASLGTVLIIWFLAASGLNESFSYQTAADPTTLRSIGYSAFLVPGMATMVVMFSAVFAALSLIQDRQAGFLQSTLVSPAPMWAIVGSKVLGGTLIASGQGLLVLIAAPIAGAKLGFGIVPAVMALVLTSAAVISLGLALAWWINSIAGFHGIMNIVLLPMWALSGSLFPAERAAGWLSRAVALNPLHWCTRALAKSMGVGQSSLWHWLGMLVFAAAMFGLAWAVMSKRIARPASEGEA